MSNITPPPHHYIHTAKDAILAIDIGTSYIKVAVFSPKHHTASQNSNQEVDHANNDCIVYKTAKIIYPMTSDTKNAQSASIDYVHYASSIRIQTITLIEQVIDSCKQDMQHVCITTIVISTHGPSTVAVDATFTPLYTIPWDYPHTITAQPQCHSYFLPQIVHFMHAHPSLYKRTAHFLSFGDYLSASLTIEKPTYSSSIHDAFTKYIWDSREIQLLKLDMRRFSPTVVTGSLCGHFDVTCIRDDLRAYFLPLSVRSKHRTSDQQKHQIEYSTENAQTSQVLYGMLDYLSALLGTRSTIPQRLCLRTGSSVVLNACKDGTHWEVHPDYTPQAMFVLPHIVPTLTNVGIRIPQDTINTRQDLIRAISNSYRFIVETLHGGYINEYDICMSGGIAQDKKFVPALTEALYAIHPCKLLEFTPPYAELHGSYAIAQRRTLSSSLFA